jgi:hypothetical protein
MFFVLERYATGVPVLDAQADFQRARRAYARARIRRWLGRRGSPARPLVLADPLSTPVGAPSLEVVVLGSIIGTVEPTRHFDAAFRPASEVVRARWERIALAHRSGAGLPPIAVWRRCEGYYVADGRHRVSVARALGHRDIDAWVSGGPGCLGVAGRWCRRGGSPD